jgi:nucleoid-associated protein YgaU
MTSLSGSQSQLYLQDNDTGDAVYFRFNPEQISLTHATQNSGAPTLQTSARSADGRKQVTAQHAAGQPGYLNIVIEQLLLVGPLVKDDCEQLLDWTVPAQKQGQTVQLPELTLQWGDLTFAHVRLYQLGVTYQRFSTSGLPIRAHVKLTLHRLDPPLPPTNPSSGGLPGRRSHIVVAGENLQQIATSTYGRPAAWRAIAIANGIEDPMRVHPGAVVYLPGPEELAVGSKP